MRAKSKVNAFVRKFESSALGKMNVIEKKTTFKGKPGRSYYAVVFTLPPRPTRILRSMRQYMNDADDNNLGISKGSTLRGIGTMYTVFFKDS